MTLSRAYYWLGRAAEAGGPGNAKAYFARAAAYGTTFYGQLAAERIGRHGARRRLSLADAPPTARILPAAKPSRAIKRLQEAGYDRYADALYRDLAGQLTSPGELALLAAMAEKQGNHFLALKVGKIAGARGIDVGALSHPLGAIPDTADISGSGKALAYAIARQESEFNVGAVSRRRRARPAAADAGHRQAIGQEGRLAVFAGAADQRRRLQRDAGRRLPRRAARPLRRLLRADLRRLQCRPAAAPRNGWRNMATRAARTSTPSSTGSSAFPTRKRAATCSA